MPKSWKLCQWSPLYLLAFRITVSYIHNFVKLIFISAFSKISLFSFAYPRYWDLSCASLIEHEILEKKNSPKNAGDMHLCIARSFLDEKFLCAIEKRVTERTEIFFARECFACYTGYLRNTGCPFKYEY